jgi:ribosome maturation factor RimP
LLSKNELSKYGKGAFMSKITDLVLALAKPVAEANGCEIWDVEYIKEAGGWYLRVYLDKDGGVSIDDCEAVSRALDPILDENDPIPTSYIFEVSSAGAERELKRPSDFERFIGNLVEVRHYQPIEGSKSHVGTLTGYDNGAVTILNGKNEKRYDKSQVAMVRLRMTV